MYTAQLNGRTKNFKTRIEVINWFWSQNDSNDTITHAIPVLLDNNGLTGVNFEYRCNTFSFSVKTNRG